MIQAINSAMCIGIYHIARTRVLQASLFYKINKYFYINKNNTGYHKALTHLRARERESFAQPQSKLPALVSTLNIPISRNKNVDILEPILRLLNLQLQRQLGGRLERFYIGEK
jgi:hypothetical protein